MTYIFMTFTMKGVAGNALYIDNKMRWLQDRGWDCIVFDHYGGLNTKEPIIIPSLQKFKENRKAELFFPPVYYTKKQRERILDWICEKIRKDTKYVVESHSPRIALWGELLASRLNAKHLFLEVGEHLEIRSNQEFKYLNFKLKRKELFFINPRVAQLTFQGYRDIGEEEAKQYYFSAIMGVKPIDISFPMLNNLPSADYRILSFGRTKPYFKNMIDGVIQFAHKNPNKIINFLIMGDVNLSDVYPGLLDNVKNLKYFLIPSMNPVPQSVFRYADVTIATAGCANIAFKEGCKTISINVEDNSPLGVMGYTTTDIVFNNQHHQEHHSLSQLIYDILLTNKYNGAPLLEEKPVTRGYDFQLNLVNEDKKYWKDVEKISMDINPLKRMIISIILKLGGINMFVNNIR